MQLDSEDYDDDNWGICSYCGDKVEIQEWKYLEDPNPPHRYHKFHKSCVEEYFKTESGKLWQVYDGEKQKKFDEKWEKEQEARDKKEMERKLAIEKEEARITCPYCKKITEERYAIFLGGKYFHFKCKDLFMNTDEGKKWLKEQVDKEKAEQERIKTEQLKKLEIEAVDKKRIEEEKRIQFEKDCLDRNQKRKKTFVLCLFLGIFGIHRFYNGRGFTGFLMAITFGFSGIGWIIDLILIATGNFKDKNGNKLCRLSKKASLSYSKEGEIHE